MSTVISYPIPAYANVPINTSFYSPNLNFISNIELGRLTTVTLTADTQFIVGQNVRFIIPRGYGCSQLNEKSGYIVEVPTSTQVKVAIDTSQNTDPFVSAGLNNIPQLLSIGDVNLGYQSSTGPIVPSVGIPGAFINIG